MLGLMNSPMDGFDVYAMPKSDGKAPVFETSDKKPKVNYLQDGRKIIDGKIQDPQESIGLWSDLLKRSVTAKLQEGVITKKQLEPESSGIKQTQKIHIVIDDQEFFDKKTSQEAPKAEEK